ncbi:MAG: type IV pilin protein [Thermomonas sp.]|nr:type IV pilin protein [Thermomonas sp.]
MDMTKQRPAQRHSAGFTLIELLVVVAIIGVLSSIAYPSYVDHVRRTRRVAAEGCLSALAQQLERFYTTNMTYVGFAGAPNCDPKITSDFYNIPAPVVTARAYTLTAAPKGSQSGDSCGTLTLDQAGTKSPSTAGCW